MLGPMNELLSGVVPSLCCLLLWAPMAGLAGFGAHRRMVSVERADGARAAPADEAPLALYAVASIAWPFAFLLACVGLAYRKWARIGRGSTFILLAHFTVIVVGALGLVLAQGRGRDEVGPIFIVACSVVAFGVLLSAALAWRWAGVRARRIGAGAPTGPPLGLERFGLYLVAGLVPAAGLIVPFAMAEPQHAALGKVSARLAVVGLATIALAVCVAVVALVPLLAR